MQDQIQSETAKSKNRIAILALLVGGIIMGFSPVFVRAAEVDAFSSAFWRIGFALPFLYIWHRNEVKSRKASFGMRFDGAIILSGLMFAGDLVFWHLAILHTSMANATFTVCLSVVWVALFSNIFLGEKTNASVWVGVIICLIGLVLLVQASFSFDASRLIGDIYGIITSLFLGIYVLAIRSVRRSMGSGTVFFSSSVITLIALLVVVLVGSSNPIPKSWEGWGSLVSLGIITHVGGQGLVTIALGTLSAVFSSLVIFIEALAAALFGWWIYSEEITFMQGAGGALIVLGVWFARPRDI